MIKLNLDLQHLKLKLLADISIDQQPTILSFLSRVLSICSITDVKAEELELYDGEYVLPHLLCSKYIKIDGNYVIRNRKLGKKEGQASKADEKAKEKTNNKRFTEEESSESESDSESSSSPLEEISKLKPIQKRPIQHKPNPKHLISSSESSSEDPLPKKKVASLLPKKAPAKVLANKSSSESDTPPHEKPKGKAKLIKENKNKTVVNKGVTNVFNKEVDKMSSDSDSSNKSENQKIRPKNYISKVQEILLNVNEKFHKNNQSQGRENGNTKPKSIPIALRNKMNKAIGQSEGLPIKEVKREIGLKNEKVNENNNELIIGEEIQQQAERYQESKWVSITKSILKKWEEQHQNAPIFDPQNSIRFKVMELDEEKFVPVTTGWISGIIEKSEQKGISTHVYLINVSKEQANTSGSTEFLKEFSVPLHNMQELQINRATLTTLQKEIISAEEPKKHEAPIKEQTQITSFNSELMKPEQSLNDYVCGQISYYFSEKNYPNDLFMKMNANKDEKGFIDVRLMTNFGKIKKVVTDDKKVWEFLVNDEKLKSRNYELDLDRRMLRKK